MLRLWTADFMSTIVIYSESQRPKGHWTCKKRKKSIKSILPLWTIGMRRDASDTATANPALPSRTFRTQSGISTTVAPSRCPLLPLSVLEVHSSLTLC